MSQTSVVAAGAERNRTPYETVLDTVGWTPLIRLHKVTRGMRTPVYAKAEIFNPGVRLLFQRHPVALIARFPVNLASEQNRRDFPFARVEHVRRAEVTHIDRAVGETFENDRGGERNVHFRGLAEFGLEKGRERFAFGEHLLGILVGLERHDDFGQRFGGARGRDEESSGEARREEAVHSDHDVFNTCIVYRRRLDGFPRIANYYPVVVV